LFDEFVANIEKAKSLQTV